MAIFIISIFGGEKKYYYPTPKFFITAGRDSRMTDLIHFNYPAT
jgi:hypothetical protein